jgi:hypothetical protein
MGRYSPTLIVDLFKCTRYHLALDPLITHCVLLKSTIGRETIAS